MLHWFYGRPVCRGVLLGLPMLHQLLGTMGVPALAEAAKVLCVDGTNESVLLGQLALPFSENRVALLPIVLLGGGELLGVIGLRLAGTDWLRDGEHTASLLLKVEGRLEFLIAIDFAGIFGAIRVGAGFRPFLFGRLIRLRFDNFFVF